MRVSSVVKKKKNKYFFSSYSKYVIIINMNWPLLGNPVSRSVVDVTIGLTMMSYFFYSFVTKKKKK